MMNYKNILKSIVNVSCARNLCVMLLKVVLLHVQKLYLVSLLKLNQPHSPLNETFDIAVKSCAALTAKTSQNLQMMAIPSLIPRPEKRAW